MKRYTFNDLPIELKIAIDNIYFKKYHNTFSVIEANYIKGSGSFKEWIDWFYSISNNTNSTISNELKEKLLPYIFGIEE